MIAKNRAQLKAWIKNMSAKVDVNENIILNKIYNTSRCNKCISRKTNIDRNNWI